MLEISTLRKRQGPSRPDGCRPPRRADPRICLRANVNRATIKAAPRSKEGTDDDPHLPYTPRPLIPIGMRHGKAEEDVDSGQGRDEAEPTRRAGRRGDETGHNPGGRGEDKTVDEPCVELRHLIADGKRSAHGLSPAPSRMATRRRPPGESVAPIADGGTRNPRVTSEHPDPGVLGCSETQTETYV
jgi:hypothetical protein